MNNQEIVQKLWNLASVLRDDGVSYQDYVTELTFILFLKMMKEQGTESVLPEGYRWDDLVSKDGLEMYNFYKKMLLALGDAEETSNKKVNAIYANASTSIDEPANLAKIVRSIDQLDWYSAKEEGLGNLYEGLLQKNANEIKSGAGQYFTPRVLIDVIVQLIDPQPGEKLNDPAAGTFGFMIKASQYIKANTDDYFDLSEKLQEFEHNEAFSGMELVPTAHRLALMNALLHDIDGRLEQGDSLSAAGQWMNGFDVVLTNPPFGTKRGGERATRDDLTYATSNKQLNFLQIIYNSLNKSGKARAAVIVPDNVLFADGVGEKIRKDLLNKCNLHTILRLPAGIFYAQGVQTNVLFFVRGKEDTKNTQETWVYDMRTNARKYGKTNPLKKSDFDDFIKCYNVADINHRKETWSAENPNGRWRKYSIADIMKRPNTNLDFSWISTETEEDTRSISELLNDMNQQSKAIADSMEKLSELLKDVQDD